MSRKPPLNKHGTLQHDHHCDWGDFVKIWGNNSHRKKLIQKATPALQMLKKAGVKTVYIAGSFASNKPNPKDIDGVFETGDDFDESELPDNFLVFLYQRGLDFYADTTPTEFNGAPHIEFFRIGRNDEKPGLIVLSLSGIP
jgi:hypothetical protein